MLTCLRKMSSNKRMCLVNVKEVTRQVLLGLSFLHDASIIHTDVKPENILMSVDYTEDLDFSEEIPNLKVKVVDLGNACWTYEKFSEEVGTRQYRAPEVLLGAGYDTTVDIWAVGCVAFELATGEYLFDPRMEPGAMWHKDEKHLEWIMELLGPLPYGLVERGKHWRKFFKAPLASCPLLKHFGAISTTPLRDVLQKDYGWGRQEAEDFSSWLLPMLELRPENRELDQEIEELEDIEEKMELDAEVQKSHRIRDVVKNVLNKEDEGDDGTKVAFVSTKMSLQELRLGLSSKEISIVKASRHRTSPLLPPVDVILERELKTIAKASRYGLCSGRKIVEHLGELGYLNCLC